MSTARSALSICLLAISAMALTAPPASASADWEGVIDITFPVTGSQYHYSNDYHSPRSRGVHGATDIMAPEGTPIVAAMGGRVSWMSTPASSGCGYCLDVTASDGRTYGYIHMGPNSSGRELEAFSQRWRQGDRVTRGEVIGYVGCSGNASCSSGGHHLHFFIKDPSVTDPYGDHRRNPYQSLQAAECDPSPDTPFSDVCEGFRHAQDIGRLAEERLTHGCGGERFCPHSPVTRDQMASFLIRALEMSGRDTFPFRDVSSDNVHHRTIARLAAEDITKGCGSDRYCPGDAVTRAQMASFLVRALQLPPSPSPTFDDVASGHRHAADISALAAAGITKGCGGESFCPDEYVTRAQMASFLVRAFVD